MHVNNNSLNIFPNEKTDWKVTRKPELQKKIILDMSRWRQYSRGKYCIFSIVQIIGLCVISDLDQHLRVE